MSKAVKITSQKKKSRLQKKADALYQKIGSKMYDKCLLYGHNDNCGRDYSCLHHYYPKSTCSALRYNFDNGIPICVKCHCRIHSSDDPTLNNKIRDIKGEEWLKGLEDIKKNTFIKSTIGYYESVIEELKKLDK